MASITEQIKYLYAQLKCLKDGIATGLEAIDEGNGIGWRLIGRDPALFGDIGRDAIDFGINFVPNNTKGATGPISFNIGEKNEASAYGAFTHGYDNKVTGVYGSARGQYNIIENILEGFGSPWYATAIGNNNRVEGHFSSAYGYENNVYEEYSHGSGVSNEIDGAYSYAKGQLNTISGDYASALGFNNQALEDYTKTYGYENIARTSGAWAIGFFNDVLGFRDAYAFGNSNKTIANGSFIAGTALNVGDSWGVAVFGTANEDFIGAGKSDKYKDADPIFIVGNGTYTTPVGSKWTPTIKSNALFLDKGGRLFLPSVDNAKIDAAAGNVVPTKEWVLLNAGGGSQNLQQVTDAGNTTTNDIIINRTLPGSGDITTIKPTGVEVKDLSGPGPTSGVTTLLNVNGVEIVDTSHPGNPKETKYLEGILQYREAGAHETFTLDLTPGSHPTAPYTQTVQPKDGIIALTSDVDGTKIYDAVYDTEAEILALSPSSQAPKTVWARDTKAAYRAFQNFTGVTPTVAWQKLTVQYDADTDTYELPETYLGQTQNLGREIFMLGVNNSPHIITTLEPKLFLSLGRDPGFGGARQSCKMAILSDLKNGDKYCISTTAAAIGGPFVGTIYGDINNIKSDQWVEGSLLYPSETVPGELTTVKPLSNVRVVCKVEVSHATDGVISVNTTANKSDTDTSLLAGVDTWLTGDDHVAPVKKALVGDPGIVLSLAIDKSVATNSKLALPISHAEFPLSTVDGVIKSGNRTATLSYSVDTIQAQERLNIEIYMADAADTVITPINDSGLPLGLLGVQPIGVLTTGIISTLVIDTEEIIPLAGLIPVDQPYIAGHTIVFQVTCEKIGSAGANKTFTVYFGSDHFSKVRTFEAVSTDTVVNKSSVPGSTATDALNQLQNDIASVVTTTKIVYVAKTVTQVGHTLVENDPVYFHGVSLVWVLAKADVLGTLKVGHITNVVGDTFDIISYGTLSLPAHGYHVESIYYLSPTTVGQYVTVTGITIGAYNQACFIVINDDEIKILDQQAHVFTNNNSVTQFTQLADVPQNYTGNAGLSLVVNQLELGLEFVSKADLNGDSGEVFQVSDGIAPNDAVNKKQLDVLLGGLNHKGTWTPNAVSFPDKGLVPVNNGYYWICDADGVDKDGRAWSNGDWIIYNGGVDASLGTAWGQYIPTQAASFIALSDSPASYNTNAGKMVVVNQAEDAVTFVDPPPPPSATYVDKGVHLTKGRQTIHTDMWATLGDWTVTIDDQGYVPGSGASNGVITIPRAGVYYLYVGGHWANISSVGNRAMKFIVPVSVAFNGYLAWDEISGDVSTSTGNRPSQHLACMAYFNVGDTIQVQVWQNSGIDLNFVPDLNGFNIADFHVAPLSIH